MTEPAPQSQSQPPLDARKIGSAAIHAEIERMLTEMAARYREDDTLALVGIANGGIDLARRLAAGLETALGREVPCGIVDISFHRDDIGKRPITKISMPTELPFAVDDRTVLLVDDVFFSGRTVRAALNELFDQGRPQSIQFAVLFDRGHHRLPLRPDFAGFTEAIEPERKVRVALDNDDPARDRITIHAAPPEPAPTRGLF